jgi:hypothetical protein
VQRLQGPLIHDHRHRGVSGAAGGAGVAAETARDIPHSGRAEGSDGEAAPGGHRAGCVAGPQPGGVLGEGGVADMVQAWIHQRSRTSSASRSAVACPAVGLWRRGRF